MKVLSEWKCPKSATRRHGVAGIRGPLYPQQRTRGLAREPLTQKTEPRVSWEGPGQPIVLRVYGPAGEVAVPLTPVRALTLARELTEPAVSSIKIAQWGPGWPG